MNRYKRILSDFLIGIFLITGVFFQNGTAAFAQSNKPKAKDRQKTEILVKYKNDSQDSSVNESVKGKLKLSKLDTKKKMKHSKVEVLEIGESDDISKTVDELKKNSNVEYAQPNYKLNLSSTSVDPRYPEQWNLLNIGQAIAGSTGTAGIDLDVEKAWDMTLGSPSVAVGVLDTGIDISHTDLKDNIYVNTNEVPGNGIDDDGNGYIDDVNGWDFANGDNTVYDSPESDSHGTHVAGIIAASANNEGISGVAPNVRLVPLKFISDGTGYTSDAIDAMEYAEQQGVKIINCSFGGTDDNPALKEAMQNSPITFVCAAGNTGLDTAYVPTYPAGFGLSNIVSVAAIDNKGNLAGFSSFGSSIDVAAPGVDILSTIPGNNYEVMSGTSMAAPNVTGVAALVKSYLPDLTPSQIVSRIKNGAYKLPSLDGMVSTGGMVDANESLITTIPDTADEDTTTLDGNKSTTDKGAALKTLAVAVAPGLMEQIHYGENGVNAATGNYSKTFTDMSLTTPGFTLNFSRTYNSKDERKTSLMGKGWTFGLEGSFKIEPTNSSLWTAKLPNGGAEVFVKSGNNFIPNDSRSTMAMQADGTYILTTKDQYTYKFDTFGWLTEMRDRNGNTIKIIVDYDTGRIRSVTDQVGRKFNVLYGANGYISTINDAKGGRSLSYHYDSSNRLDQVTDPAGKKMCYEYDSQGYLTKIKDSSQNTLETINYDHGNPNKVSTYVDVYNNTYTYAYDTAQRKTTITDLNQRQMIKWFDTSFYTIKSEDPERKQVIIEYYVDANGVNMFGEEKSITDRNGNKTQYIRDDRGNITKLINPDGSTEEYIYDTKSNTTMEKDENGRCTYYVYDANKINLIKKLQPLSASDTYTDGADESKFFVTGYAYYTAAEAQQRGYMAKGLLKSETDPEGNVTSYSYDSYGNIRTTTDPVGNVTKNTYNPMGWLTETISPMGYKTQYVYDNDGNIEKTVLNDGQTTRTVYDGEGRKIQEISPNQYDSADDAISSHKYNNSGVGYKYAYYISGKTKSITDPLGNTTSYEYDKYGNMTKETKPNGAIYSYSYDMMNRTYREYFSSNSSSKPLLLKEYRYEILPDGKTRKTDIEYLNDKETAVTNYTNDYAGRLIEQINPDGGVLSVKYYSNGAVFSKIDETGGTTYYKYDNLNRLTEQWMQIDDGKYSYTSFAYDKAGNKTEEKLGKDKISLYAVPSTDRLIVKYYEYYPNGKVKSTKDTSGAKKDYQYDKEGNVSREDIYTDPTSINTTEYAYNQLGKITEKKTYVQSGDIYGNKFGSKDKAELITACEYDRNGNQVSVKTPDGVTTKYSFDAMDRQIKVSQPGNSEDGTQIVIENSTTYDWDGKPLVVTDALGNTTKYTYNSRGFLENENRCCKDAVGNVTNNITAYAYDLAGRRIIEVSPKNYVEDAGTTLTQMNRTEYTYDKMDRVKTKIEVYKKSSGDSEYARFVSKAYKYDYAGNVIKELDGEGFSAGSGTTDDEKINSGYGTETTYNYLEKIAAVIDPVSKEKGLSYSVRYDYDGAGRKISVTDSRGTVASYYYDDAGNPIQTTVRKSYGDVEKIIKTSEYDLSGNEIKETDGNGNITTYEYNALGKQRKIVFPGDDTVSQNTVEMQYDVMGNLMMKQDSTGAVDIYSYDKQGRLLTQTEQNEDGSDAITTSSKYDKNGNITFQTDGNGSVTKNSYDGSNRLISSEITTKSMDGKSTLHKTRFEYDKNGNKTKQIDWLGNVSENIYDPINRLVVRKDQSGTIIQKLEYNRSSLQTRSTDALGHDTEFKYDKDNRLIITEDAMGHKAFQTYDDAGNINSKADGRGNTTRYLYDQFNRLVSVIDALNEETNYTYDLNGNLITQTDGEGNTTTFEYNAINKASKKIDSGGRTGDAGKYAYDSTKTEKYTYFLDGNIKSKVDRNGATTNYTYDVHGRLILEEAGSNKISYTYDNNWNQLSMTDSTGKTTRAYDEMNRVITKSVPKIGTSVYTYDIILADSPGYVSDISKDARGNRTIKVYDKVGRLKKVSSDGTSYTVYEYDGNGNRLSVSYPNGAKEVYTYYDNNLVKTLTNKKADGSTLDSYSYTYDESNNQVSKADSKGTTSYTYDSLNRLEAVKEPGGKVTEYSFDKAGNRSRENVTQGTTSTTTVYKYNEQNRLISTETQVNGEKSITSYRYDNNGNLIYRSLEVTKKIDPKNPPTEHFGMFIPGQEEGGATEYAKPFVNAVCAYDYDEFNQLIKTSASGAVTTYAYNGDGLRVEKDENGKITRYLYEGDKVVLELDDKGYQTARNVQGINLISRTTSGTTAYYFYNGHADVTTLLDKTGAKLASYYYDAFGNITESSGSMKNPYRYAGYQYDEGTGLYYLNARYYDPETARFISEDTYRGETKDPLSLNLYTYCHNEPVMYDDPTGHREAIDADAKVQYIPQTKKIVTVKTTPSTSKSTTTVKVTTKVTKNATPKPIINTIPTSMPKSITSTGALTSSSKNSNQVSPGALSQNVSKARVEQGIGKMADGGLLVGAAAVAGAAALTVLTAGAGTPILITAIAAVTGGAAVASGLMGTSDIIEGGQDIYYGATGNGKAAVNPIRDYVFQGNSDLYNFAEMGAVTVATAGAGALAYVSSTYGGSKAEKEVAVTTQEIGKYQVGAYQDIKGVEGLDAHHVGQKSLMKSLVKNYDPQTAPAINVPKVGHTINGPNGIVSRSTQGIGTARQLLARDIMELRRVYDDIPNSALRELIELNKKMYPEMRVKL